MKKLTRTSIERMMTELVVLDKSAQQRYVGGAGTCSHNVSLSDACPFCGGHGVVSWDDYLALDKAGLWPGGWYMGNDGVPYYGLPSAETGGGVPVITGYCKEHGRYDGTVCHWSHNGLGDEYCQEHDYWYQGAECGKCVTDATTVTGYCKEHDESWAESGNITGYCPDCKEAGITGAMVFCAQHDLYYNSKLGCTACKDDPGTTGGEKPGDWKPGDIFNPYCDLDFVVTFCADSTFNEASRAELKWALCVIRDSPFGDCIYDELVLSEEFVTFTIGKTIELTDEKTGEKFWAPASYSKGVVTISDKSEINYGNLAEELTHAAQHDLYGSDFKNTNLNYEFEAKIINYLIWEGGGNTEVHVGSKEDNQEFMFFWTNVADGTITDEQLILEKYTYWFDKWQDSNYVNSGHDKVDGFDPKLLKKILGIKNY